MRCLILFCVSIGLAFSAQAGDKPRIDDRVIQDIRDKGSSRVIIGMRRPGNGQPVSAVAYMSSTLTAKVGREASLTPLNDELVVARANSQFLDTISQDPRIAFVARDEVLPPTIDDKATAIGTGKLWLKGLSGNGVAVAILDTGVDATHPMLTGKLKGEACFSVTDPTAHSVSLCPRGADVGNGDWADTSDGAGINCPVAIVGCKHGTHVAGIAVGRKVNDGAERVTGVAAGADFLSIQVYSRFDRPEDCPALAAPCALSFTSSQIRALQFIQAQVRNYKLTGQGPRIVALNLSLGDGHFANSCDDHNPTYTKEILDLRNSGVAVFVASGNQGYVDGVNFPACISEAVSVGALDDPGAAAADWSLAKFTNRSGATLISLLTFGVDVRSSVPGGGYEVHSGTSMAAPVASGAYAILAAAFPSASPDGILGTMRSSGVPVKEPVSGKNIPAIELAQAYDMMSPANSKKVGPAGAPPDRSANPSRTSTTRFVVEIPGGDAVEKSSELQKSLPDLSGSLNSGQIGVSPIGSDALILRTEKPTDPGKLQEGLQKRIQGIGKVTADEALPPM